MEVRTCRRCGELFYDKKNEGPWAVAGMLTIGWSTIAEPSDRKYCRGCVKD